MFTDIPTALGTRRYCSNTTKAEFEARMSTPKARMWAVRAGSTGSGKGLFDVYAETMEDARVSAVTWGYDAGSSRLMSGDFTVHAGQSVGTLATNVLADYVDAFDWDEADGPAVTVDTVNGQVEGLFLADDGAGSVLVLIAGQMEEHPAQALLPRCECGNPFRLCHPEA